MDAYFDTNLPSDYGWGAPGRTETIVSFSYGGHRFYNGVRAEAAVWFKALCDLVVPMIPGGLYTAPGGPGVDDGQWGYEDRGSRNSTSKSVHAWGMCLDFNAVQNPNHASPKDGTRYVLGSDIQAAVRAMGGLHGRGWGDNMHIECKLSPSQLAAWTKAYLAGHGGVVISKPAPGKPAPAKPAAPAAPAGHPFPLPAGFYYGPLTGPNESISGLGKNDARYKPGLAAAQGRLNAKIGTRLATDGEYGPATAAAIKTFQAKAHLAVDGELGPNTWRALWT